MKTGMFINWGISPKGEWRQSIEKIPVEDYTLYFLDFDPNDYNPAAWAKEAKDAGVEYAVMTAKTHDGFCLFNSLFTDYKSTSTPAKGDLIQEYVEAFRAEGIKIGLYYSLLDWHHPDYPAYGDKYHPMRDNEDYEDWAQHQDFNKYLKYIRNQVEELCTCYGKIDLFWFGFCYDDMTAEKFQTGELASIVKRYHPKAQIDLNIKPDENQITIKNRV